MKSYSVVKCFTAGLFFALYTTCACPMNNSWFMGPKAPEEKKWVKRKEQKEGVTPTADVLDGYLKENNFPEAISLFNYFVKKRDDQSQYALRWARDTANKGCFPILHRLIHHYYNHFKQSPSGFTIDDIKEVCALIMKADLLFRLAYQWLISKSDPNLAQSGLDCQKTSFTFYADFLKMLIEAYEPPYQEIYQAVQIWINENFKTLREISPIWIISCNNNLIFERPSKAIVDALTDRSPEKLFNTNQAFFKEVNKDNGIGHIDQKLWDNFLFHLNKVN